MSACLLRRLLPLEKDKYRRPSPRFNNILIHSNTQTTQTTNKQQTNTSTLFTTNSNNLQSKCSLPRSLLLSASSLASPPPLSTSARTLLVTLVKTPLPYSPHIYPSNSRLTNTIKQLPGSAASPSAPTPSLLATVPTLAESPSLLTTDSPTPSLAAVVPV
jgi:hypothetical protein